jgi:hypothetical protein
MPAHWSHDRTYQRNRAALLDAARRGLWPCARCGGPIDYDGPRYLPLPGRRRENPLAFDAGHVVAKAEGGTHELANLQPEHVRCNRVHGAHLGNQRLGRPRRARTELPPVGVLILDDW